MAEAGFIYAIGVEGAPSVKIGKTAGPVTKRLAMLQTGHPAPLTVLAAVSVDQDLSRIEKAIHRFLAADRQQGEWFAVQVNQPQLEALIVRAVQWLAEEPARQAAEQAARLARREGPCMLGDRVKQRRLELDLTQDQLAAVSGLKQFHISQIERGGIVEVKTQTIRRLAKALRTTTDFLLEMEEQGDSEIQPTALATVGT